MPEVSIWHGLHPDFRERVGELVDNRLRPSSRDTIGTALRKWWRPYCAKYELTEFIPSGHPHRGAIMAGFVLFMAAPGSIVYSTMTGYVWAVVDTHLSNGYASPLSNVRDWKPFMHSCEVEWGRPSEPRRMVPWLLFIRTLQRIDFTIPWEVAVGCVMLCLFFLISRPELLPLTQGGFDPHKHLRRQDFRWLNGYLEVCMRSIKQDPQCKRSAIVAGVAWRAIGNCTGILDTLGMVQRYLSMVSHATPDSPMFLDDRGKPLTEAAFTRLMRVLFQRVPGCSAEDAALYSGGGLRVLARNAVAGVEGSDTARIQGMWASDAHMYYDRPFLERVLALPSKMASFAASAAMPPRGALESVSMSFLSEMRPAGGGPALPPEAPPPAPTSPFLSMLATSYTLVTEDPDPLGGIRHEPRVTKTGRSYSVYYVGAKQFNSLVSAQRFLAGRSLKAALPPAAAPVPAPAVAPPAAAPRPSSRRSAALFTPTPAQSSRLRGLL